MVQGFAIPYLWVSVFLVLCSLFDFYSSKIPNHFILFSFFISILNVFLFTPQTFWFLSLQSFIIMFVLGFVLFNFKILGGGDIKSLCLVALFLYPHQIQYFLIYSLIWAGAYSFIFYALSGQILNVLYNTVGVYKKFAVANNKIPFTFGILLGWFSLFSLGVLSWS